MFSYGLFRKRNLWGIHSKNNKNSTILALLFMSLVSPHKSKQILHFYVDLSFSR